MDNNEQGLTRTVPKRDFSLLPATLGEAKELAMMIANSEFAPKDYKGKPESVLIAVQMGADLGLKPMQALQNIAVINGRPSIWGDGAMALAMPALVRFKEWIDGEGDKMTAHCLIQRKGWPDETERTFSVDDAKKANLWGKSGPWSTYPKRMLQMRARSWALRDACADLLMGMVLSEEALDYPDAIDTTGRVEDAKSDPVEDPMLRVPEGMRAGVGKGFDALHMGPGPVAAKIAEFMGATEGTDEERATKLLEWLRDEYAKRKTGQPRAKNDNAKRESKKTEAPAVIDVTPTPKGEEKPVEQAPTVTEVFKDAVDAVEF